MEPTSQASAIVNPKVLLLMRSPLHQTYQLLNQDQNKENNNW